MVTQTSEYTRGDQGVVTAVEWDSDVGQTGHALAGMSCALLDVHAAPFAAEVRQ